MGRDGSRDGARDIGEEAVKLSSGIAEVFEAYCESEHAKIAAELDALCKSSPPAVRQALVDRLKAFLIVAVDLREKCKT